MSVEPEFWQPKEAARYLNIHVRTLYAWLAPLDTTQSGRPRTNTKNIGKLLGPKPPFKKFSYKCIRFPVEEFKAWAHKHFATSRKGK